MLFKVQSRGRQGLGQWPEVHAAPHLPSVCRQEHGIYFRDEGSLNELMCKEHHLLLQKATRFLAFDSVPKTNDFILEEMMLEFVGVCLSIERRRQAWLRGTRNEKVLKFFTRFSRSNSWFRSYDGSFNEVGVAFALAARHFLAWMLCEERAKGGRRTSSTLDHVHFFLRNPPGSLGLKPCTPWASDRLAQKSIR